MFLLFAMKQLVSTNWITHLYYSSLNNFFYNFRISQPQHQMLRRCWKVIKHILGLDTGRGLLRLLFQFKDINIILHQEENCRDLQQYLLLTTWRPLEQGNPWSSTAAIILCGIASILSNVPDILNVQHKFFEIFLSVLGFPKGKNAFVKLFVCTFWSLKNGQRLTLKSLFNHPPNMKPFWSPNEKVWSNKHFFSFKGHKDTDSPSMIGLSV